MAPRYDFHIHTNLSACANAAMTLDAVVAECERVGLKRIGLTDHLNNPENAERNAALLGEIRDLDTDIQVYFGAEVGYSRKLQAHPMTRELKGRLGYQYAIGSHHSAYLAEHDVQKIVEIQHRHHLLTCADPNIDILGHPWRFLYEEFVRRGWPWFDSMSVVPEKLTRELAQAANETGTAIEINTTSNLCMKFNPDSYFEEYVDYLGVLAEEGVTFALGSDAHELHEFKTIRLAWDVVDRLGIPDDRIWKPDADAANRRG